MPSARDFTRDRLQVGETPPAAGLGRAGGFKPGSGATPEPNCVPGGGTDPRFAAGASTLGSTETTGLFRGESEAEEMASGQHHRGFVEAGRADHSPQAAAQDATLYPAVCGCDTVHSSRKALMGSRPAARWAGKKLTSIAITASMAIEAIMVTGSRG